MLPEAQARTLLQESQSLAAALQPGEAYQKVLAARQLLVVQGLSSCDPELLRQLRLYLWRLSPHWWQAPSSKRYKLRRCRVSDAAFFERCKNDAAFTSTFGRQFGWKGRLLPALQKYGAAPPFDLGVLVWVICDHDDSPLGLSIISSIDLANRKAEFSLGLLGRPPLAAAAHASFLTLDHAYFAAGFNKLYCYIYQDNILAPRNVKRLGFREEGLLVDHAYLPPAGFVSVRAFGLTRRQLQETPALVAAAERHIGKHWQSRSGG